MKKFTKVTLIIAAVFACVGIALCTVAVTVAGGMDKLINMAQNGELNFGNWHFEEGISYRNDNLFGNAANIVLDEDVLFGGNETLQRTYDEEITKIELELDAASIVIKTTEQNKVSVSMENGFTKYFTEKQDGDKLIIEYDVNGIHYKSAPNIVVYIPKDCDLKELEIEADMGNVEVLDLTQGCQNMDITAKMGNIEVHNSLVSEKCKLKADMGNVQMTEVICEKAELHAELGMVSFEGITKGDLRMTTNMGSAKAFVEGLEKDYNIYLATDMGEIHYNGKKHHTNHSNNSYESEVDNALGNIYMESSMGEVELTFN